MFDNTTPGDDDDGHDYGGFEMRAAILDGHTVVPVRNTLKWAQWFETADRRVASTMLGRTHVSTVFLGLDHGYHDVPQWFETMVFRADGTDTIERYPTWDAAEAGHARMVQRERASFRAWVIGAAGWQRARVAGWAPHDGVVELDNGTVLPLVLVYRSRRRVPFRASTYARRFGAVA